MGASLAAKLQWPRVDILRPRNPAIHPRQLFQSHRDHHLCQCKTKNNINQTEKNKQLFKTLVVSSEKVSKQSLAWTSSSIFTHTKPYKHRNSHMIWYPKTGTPKLEPKNLDSGSSAGSSPTHEDVATYLLLNIDGFYNPRKPQLKTKKPTTTRVVRWVLNGLWSSCKIKGVLAAPLKSLDTKNPIAWSIIYQSDLNIWKSYSL